MKDIQSPLGNGHWLYGVLKRPLRLGQVLQLYHSLIPPQTVPADATLTEAIPEFKAHHILTEDSSGATVLDIPYLTLEDDRILSDCVNRAAERLKADLADGVKKLTAGLRRRVRPAAGLLLRPAGKRNVGQLEDGRATHDRSALSRKGGAAGGDF